MPVSDIVCGLLPALSVIVSVADRDPMALGVKVMLITQLEFAATGLLVVQVVPPAMANSELPVEGAAVKVKLPLPVFATVTGSGELVTPIAWGVGKFSVEAGVKTTVGAVPVPVKLIACEIGPLPVTPAV